jgi:flagellar biosynthetic protein FliO
MRSTICTLLVVMAALGPLAAGRPARGEGANPAAGAVKANEVAAAPSDADAVSSWMHQTLARPKDSTHPQRAAAEGSVSPRKGNSLGLDTRTGTLDLLWPLLLVLGAIAGVAFFIRKVLPRGSRLGGSGVIDVVAHHYLSNKQSLCLIRLGRRAVLIGVTPERITPVAEISQPEELAEIVAAIERKRPTSFTSTFARLCARDPGKAVTEESVEAPDPAANEKLVRAGESLRDLVGRIRAWPETRASAEPT